MTDRQIEVFLKVCEAGSFSRAARELYMTPQSLAQHVNRLEQEVGFALFDRKFDGVVPTAAGEAFRVGASDTTARMRALVASCRSMAAPDEVVRVGSISLTPYLSLFAEALALVHPEVRLEFVMLPHSDARALDAVADGTVDVLEWVDEPSIGQRGLAHSAIEEKGLFCLVSHRHEFARREALRLEDLAGERLGTTYAAPLVNVVEALAGLGHAATIEDSGADARAITRFCLDGGVYLMAGSEPLAALDLATVPVDCDISWQIGFAHRPDPAPAVVSFIEVATSLHACAFDYDAFARGIEADGGR